MRICFCPPAFDTFVCINNIPYLKPIEYNVVMLSYTSLLLQVLSYGATIFHVNVLGNLLSLPDSCNRSPKDTVKSCTDRDLVLCLLMFL